MSVEKYLEKGFEVLRGKEVLYQLEKEGRYVFHGSPTELGTIEPRQSVNISKKGEKYLHGAPAVSATKYADIAIFMSMIHQNMIPIEFRSGFGSRSETKNGKLVHSYYLDQNAKKYLDEHKDEIIGKVYFFNKNDFEYFARNEVRSYKPVYPLGVVLVKPEDLPEYEIK